MNDMNEEKWQEIAGLMGVDSHFLLNAAARIANSLWQPYVGMEHLFLVMAHMKGSLTFRVLEGCGVAPAVVAAHVMERAGATRKEPPTRLKPTPRLVKLLVEAGRLATSENYAQAGERHLLLAMLEDPDNLPIRVLQKELQRQGRDLDFVKQAAQTAVWEPPADGNHLPYVSDEEEETQKRNDKRDIENAASIAGELANEGRFAEALMTINYALRLDPNNAVAYSNRGSIYERLNQQDLALADFERAIELDPRYARAVFNRAGLLYGLGNSEEALINARHALKIDPDHAGSHALIARILSERGDTELALEEFDLALHLDPNLQWALVERAVLLFSHDPKMAEADLMRALELNPEDLRALGMIATLCTYFGRDADAVQTFNRAIAFATQANIPTGVYCSERGKALLRLGRLTEAKSDLQRAIAEDTTNAELHTSLGLACQEMGEYEESLLNFSRSIDLQPENAMAFFYRANTHTMLGKDIEALADLDRAIELDPQLQVAYVNRSGRHLRLGHQDAALSDLTVALELDPEDDVARFNLASLLIGAEDYENGLQQLDAAARRGNLRAAQAAAQLRGKLEQSAPYSFDLLQIAIDALESAATPAEVQRLVAHYPLMTEPAFIHAAQQRTWNLTVENRSEYQKRVAWLRRIPRVSIDARETSYHRGDKIGERYLVFDVRVGGMAEVYLCLDMERNYPYALKTVKGRYITDPDEHARFYAEAETWVYLEKHPNIVRCFSLQEVDRHDFLFLEWVRGTEEEDTFATTLRDLLYRGALEPRLALDLAIDIVRGLVYATDKLPGMVHQDLSPENVLIAEGWVAKITDFGLALAPGLVTSDPLVGILVGGKYPYMAPEQWRGGELDQRTDLYAFGCLFYEMLTGQQPFRIARPDPFDEDLWRQSWQQAHETAARPHLPPEVFSGLQSIVHTCLAKSPRMRYQAASALLADLTSVYEEAFGQPARNLPDIQGFSAYDFAARGTTFYRLGRYQEALADHDHALAIAPEFVAEYGNRGNAFAALGLTEEALNDYARAIEKNSEYVPAYLNRASLYHELGNFQEALTDVHRGLALDPRFKELYIVQANVLHALDQSEEALKAFSHALELDPEYVVSYVSRADVLFDLGRIDEAQADLDRAIELDPLSSQAFHRRGLLRAHKHQFESAFGDFDRALEIDPGFALAYAERGLAHHAAERYAKAIGDFDQAILLQPDLALAYMARSMSEGFLGNYAQALSDAEHALHLDPNSSQCWIVYATALASLGHSEESLQSLQQALELNPDADTALQLKHDVETMFKREQAFLLHGETTSGPQSLTNPNEGDRPMGNLLERGKALVASHKTEEALHILSRAVALYPDHPAPFLHRGHFYFDSGQFKLALDDYNAALRNDPNLIQAHSSKGNALTRLGRYQNALESHQHAIDLDTEHAISYLNRGGTYAQVGEEDSAMADWRHALALNPELVDAHRNLGFLLFQQKQFHQALPHLAYAAQAGVPNAKEMAEGSKEILSMGFYLFMMQDSPDELPALVREFPFLTDPGYLMEISGAALNQIADADRSGMADRLTSLWKLSQATSLSDYLCRANAFLNLQKYELALEGFDGALDLDESSQVALAGRACALYNLQRYGDAIACCDRLLGLDALNPQAHYFKALALGDSQGVWAALPYINRTIELAPGFSEAYIVRAMLQMFGNKEAALADLAKAEALGNPQAKGMMDWLESQSGL